MRLNWELDVNVEIGLTPHSELFPSTTLKYIPENSGHMGNLSQKYESTATVRPGNMSIEAKRKRERDSPIEAVADTSPIFNKLGKVICRERSN